METTKVVSVRVGDIRPTYANLKEWVSDTNNVYIGRRGIVFIDGRRFPEENSVWANPFKPTKNESVETCIEKYEFYINKKIENGEITADQLKFLKGKTLGCWCKIGGKDLPCHGDVLVKIIEKM